MIQLLRWELIEQPCRHQGTDTNSSHPSGRRAESNEISRRVAVRPEERSVDTRPITQRIDKRNSNRPLLRWRTENMANPRLGQGTAAIDRPEREDAQAVARHTVRRAGGGDKHDRAKAREAGEDGPDLLDAVGEEAGAEDGAGGEDVGGDGHELCFVALPAEGLDERGDEILHRLRAGGEDEEETEAPVGLLARVIDLNGSVRLTYQVLQSTTTILKAFHSPIFSWAPCVKPMPWRARRLHARMRSSSVKNLDFLYVGKSGRTCKYSVSMDSSVTGLSCSRATYEESNDANEDGDTAFEDEEPSPATHSSCTVHVLGDNTSEETRECSRKGNRGVQPGEP